MHHVFKLVNSILTKIIVIMIFSIIEQQYLSVDGTTINYVLFTHTNKYTHTHNSTKLTVLLTIWVSWSSCLVAHHALVNVPLLMKRFEKGSETKL